MLARMQQIARSAAAAWSVAAIVAGFGPLGRPCAAAEEDRRPLKVVAAGTTVEDADRDRWNRVVLLATPRFVSGDTDAVSDGIRGHVTSFTFTVLATVRTTGAAEDARHELAEVGVCYSTPVNGRPTVVAPGADVPGFSLDFLGRQILGAKQKSLDEIVQVGAHGTALAFDAPLLMLRDGEHREMTVRHVVRVDPLPGACSTCVWLAQPNDDGTLTPAGDPLRLVGGGTRESRAIHVDGSRFVFGFPTKQAFAVKELPPGTSIPWSPTLLVSADAAIYDGDAFQTLTRAIDDAARGTAVRAAVKPSATRAE